MPIAPFAAIIVVLTKCFTLRVHHWLSRITRIYSWDLRFCSRRLSIHLRQWWSTWLLLLGTSQRRETCRYVIEGRTWMQSGLSSSIGMDKRCSFIIIRIWCELGRIRVTIYKGTDLDWKSCKKWYQGYSRAITGFASLLKWSKASRKNIPFRTRVWNFKKTAMLASRKIKRNSKYRW